MYKLGISGKSVSYAMGRSAGGSVPFRKVKFWFFMCRCRGTGGLTLFGPRKFRFFNNSYHSAARAETDQKGDRAAASFRGNSCGT